METTETLDALRKLAGQQRPAEVGQFNFIVEENEPANMTADGTSTMEEAMAGRDDSILRDLVDNNIARVKTYADASMWDEAIEDTQAALRFLRELKRRQ